MVRMAALRGHASTRASGRLQRGDVRAHAALLTQRVALPTASTGLTFSPIINGCWQLAGGHGREVFDNIEEKLWAAADAGFTSFDTADIYGPSEQIVGKFQRRWAETSGKPPVQVFTKYVPNVYNARPTPALVEAAVRRSLNALQVPRLDLVQLHWWEYSVPGLEDTALALAELQARGLVAAVGTTNMNVAALARIEDAGVRLASNQVQFSLLDRRPLNGMLQYCQARGIKLLTYGSVGGGLLSDKFAREQPKTNLFGKKTYAPVDLNTSSLKMYWNIVKGFGGQELWRDLLAALRQVADKHSVSVANVALRWVMQQGDGATVFPIVGLRGTSHLADNARTLALQLDAQDVAAIQAVLDRAEGPEGDIYSFERGE